MSKLKIAIPSCNYHKRFISPLLNELIMRLREVCKEKKIEVCLDDHEILSPNVMSNKIDFNTIVSVGFSGINRDLIKKYKDADVKIIIVMDDIHKKLDPKKASQFVTKKHYFEQANNLFLMYPNHFNRMEEFKNIKEKCIPFPWYFPEVALKYDIPWEKRKDKITLTGIVDTKVYTLRYNMHHFYIKHPEYNVEVLKHPTYKHPKGKFGFSFYKYLSEYKSSISTSANAPLDYLLAKYFEILGCGCVGFFEQHKELDDLGFIENKHYIKFNKDNYRDVIKMDKVTKVVAEEGKKFVSENHTDRIRANQLINKVVELYG